jgi:hypothetical protein
VAYPRFRHADLPRRRCAGMRQDWSEPSRTSWPCKPDQGRLWHSRPPLAKVHDHGVDHSLKDGGDPLPAMGKGSTLILKEAPKNYSRSNREAGTASPR